MLFVLASLLPTTRNVKIEMKTCFSRKVCSTTTVSSIYLFLYVYMLFLLSFANNDVGEI